MRKPDGANVVHDNDRRDITSGACLFSSRSIVKACQLRGLGADDRDCCGQSLACYHCWTWKIIYFRIGIDRVLIVLRRMHNIRSASVLAPYN